MTQASSLPIRPRVRHISTAATAMSYGQVAEMVRRARGTYLRQIVDAAATSPSRASRQRCARPPRPSSPPAESATRNTGTRR